MIEDPDKQSDGSFLSRWSRRKQEQEIKPDLDQKTEEHDVTLGQAISNGGASNQQSLITPESQSSAPLSDTIPRAGNDAPVLTDEDMPPLETLDEHSDFSGFMSPGVSQGLRKLALRKLFSSAGFNIRDGLDDYDDDFTSFEPLGDLITSDMKHQAEMAEKRKREAEEKAAEAGRLEGAEDEIETVTEGIQTESLDDQEKTEDSGENRTALSQQSSPDEQDPVTDENQDMTLQETKNQS